MKKITVSKSELSNKLGLISKIIQAKNSLPIFNSFLFEVDSLGLLKVTAGEEGGMISTNIECQLDFRDLAFTIDASTLLNGCKEIPEQPLVFDIENKDTYLEICVHYSNGKFELVGGKADEYPKIKLDSPEVPFILDAQDFLYGIRQAQICASSSDLRPVMQGVFIDKDYDGITYVSSDGATLGMVEDSLEPTDRSSFIIPERITRVLSKIIPSGCEQISITASDKNVMFDFDCYRLICRMIDGRYPNYRSVIPTTNNKKATFVKNDLISALKRVSVFCSISSSLVVCSFENDKLTLSGCDVDFSTSAEEEVSITYSGDPIKIGFKGSTLIELLSNIPSAEAIITMQDQTRAGIIRRADEEKEGLTYLIMPMVINN